MEIPFAATGDKYGYLDFVVRIWLEGQSDFCFDDNAGQSWKIDLAFSMDKFADTSGSSNP